MFVTLDLHGFLAHRGQRLYEIRGAGDAVRLKVGPAGDRAAGGWLAWPAFLQQYGGDLKEKFDGILDFLPDKRRKGARLTPVLARDLMNCGVPPDIIGRLRPAADAVEILRDLVRRDRGRCTRTTAPKPRIVTARLAPANCRPKKARAVCQLFRQYSVRCRDNILERVGDVHVHRYCDMLARIGQVYLSSELFAGKVVKDPRHVEVAVYQPPLDPATVLMQAAGLGLPIYVFDAPLIGITQYHLRVTVAAADADVRPCRRGGGKYDIPAIWELLAAAEECLAQDTEVRKTLFRFTGAANVQQFKDWLKSHEVAHCVRVLTSCWDAVLGAQKEISEAAVEYLAEVAQKDEAAEEDLARRLYWCAAVGTDPRLASLKSAALTGLEKAVRGSSVGEIGVWVRWLQPACSTWVLALCDRGKTPQSLAEWLGVIDHWLLALEGSGVSHVDGTRLAVAHDENGEPALAVEVVPGPPVVIRTWVPEKGPWQFAGAKELADGMVRLRLWHDDPYGLPTLLISTGANAPPQAWAWHGRSWEPIKFPPAVPRNPQLAWENVGGAWRFFGRPDSAEQFLLRKESRAAILKAVIARAGSLAGDDMAAFLRFIIPASDAVETFLLHLPQLVYDPEFQTAMFAKFTGDDTLLTAFFEKQVAKEVKAGRRWITPEALAAWIDFESSAVKVY